MCGVNISGNTDKIGKSDDNCILKEGWWKDYKLHVTILVIVIISEFIGPFNFNVVKDVSIMVMPLIYAMVIGLALFLLKPVKWIGKKQSKIAEGVMLLFMGPLVAKFAIACGESFPILVKVGPALILQEFGHLGTIFLALPVALLLGFKRETIGMTNSIGREGNVAVVMDKFGLNSAETRGILTVYVIGTVVGAVFISLFSSLFVALVPLHPYAFAMGAGVGSASMNAAALAPILAAFPKSMATNIQAFAGFSNLISSVTSIYFCVFLALPITEKLYNILEPKIGRKTSVSNIGDEE